MRLQDKYLSFVVNFLVGVSWGTLLVGAVSAFVSFSQEGFFFIVVAVLTGMLPGMISILLLEHFITSKEQYFELQKQTKLLQQLLEEKDNNHNAII